MRDRKGVDSEGRGGGKDLGGREGEESIIRMYFMRQESPLNKREKKVLKEKEKKLLSRSQGRRTPAEKQQEPVYVLASQVHDHRGHSVPHRQLEY